MNLEFVNSGGFELILIAVIIVIGIGILGIIKLYRKIQYDKLPKKFERLATTNLNEARNSILKKEEVYQKIWYMALSMIAADNLGNPKWRLKDFGTDEREIFQLLKLSFKDIETIAEKGVNSAKDILCIIERCREDIANHS